MITSKKLLALSFFISICIFASTSRAADHLLATITTDVDADSYQLSVNSSDEDETLTSFYISNYSNGSMLEQKELPIKNFIRDGIKVGPQGGYSFAQVSSKNFNQEDGGTIVINTVYNALTGKRKYYELELIKDQDHWTLSYGGQVITQIFAKANRIAVFGIVGAKDLIMR